MIKISCTIIDDEPKALALLKTYAERIPFLDLKAHFYNPMEALYFVQKNKIDLIFQDINMPDINGLEFLNSMPYQPLVVFTTAYSEYALESYNYQAVDYLLKPIEFDRFLKASNKVLERHLLLHSPSKREESTTDQEIILVKSGPQIHRLLLSDILFIEGSGNYVTYHCPNRKILSLDTLNRLEKDLPSSGFMRIHKSYIISIHQIRLIEKHQIHLGSIKLPIGKNYRSLVLQKFRV